MSIGDESYIDLFTGIFSNSDSELRFEGFIIWNMESNLRYVKDLARTEKENNEIIRELDLD